MIHSDPFSNFGQDIHRLDRDKADKHQIHSLEGDVKTLERKLSGAQADINGLRSQIELLQNQVNGLFERESP